MAPITIEELQKDGIPAPERCPKCGNGRVKVLTKHKEAKLHGSRSLYCGKCKHQWTQFLGE